MNKIFSKIAWEDYLYWQQNDKKILKKINTLIKDIERSHFDGLGKPEPLRYLSYACWSRRIDTEHRLVYYVENESIFIVQCKTHYESV